MEYTEKCLFKYLQTKMEDTFFFKVYKVVKQIPEGRVATYGQIANILDTKDARKVGWALHSNKDPNVPCHRVVDKSGRLAPNFAFDGPEEQKRRLLEENVVFKDKTHVDLKKCKWDEES